ncbi:MAG: DUF1573 domain-containing protein [Flavobacteriales bacterium]|jgi:hypothetical protein|nr:DUF1573 domain-containing protein [Flavobacteriales bacterium]|tara:strand:- start:18274 stop:18729 length:456 start_codon:yes stop_codon:yes gene_type:complete
MYKYLLILTFLVISCDDAVKKVNSNEKKISSKVIMNNQTLENSKNNNQPIVQFVKEEHNFGDITQGEVVSHNFVIKNSGKSDLIISSAKGSCGCTVPVWPKDPIKPGAEAEIKVTFNSKGRSGSQTKKVTVLTNAIPNTKVLTIRGNVIIN